MTKPWYVVVSLLLLELCVILLLIPGPWMQEQILKEADYVKSSLGVETRDWIHGKANDWFDRSVLQSGLYEELHRTVIPSDREKRKSRGMENMGHDWFVWLEGRMTAALAAFYQFLTRCALLLAWAPYMLLLLIPAIYDGWTTWKIKRTNFDYASPVMHRYSVRGSFILLVGLANAFFLPVALTPMLIPVVMMAMCVLLGLAMGNMQKRI
ncbi:DUF4400 domain-containing protein [Diaphorobacter sp. DS2]|nr:DUF4400 domain-containing protein [Diaphorobacter sp. DS2]